MTHEAKALSAGSTQAGGSARGLIRRALVTRAARKGAKGSGAPAAKLLGLLAFSLIALFVTAAPAQAAIQATTPILFNPSYTSVQVRAEADMNGFGEAIVQYSTDQNDWKTGFSVGDFSFQGGLRPVKGTITGLKGSTTYFVRVYAFGYFGGDAFSPGPNPSVTTPPVDPPVITATDNASAVFSTSAIASGKVKRPANADPAFDVTCQFEYVTDDQFNATGFTGALVRPCAENPIGAADAGIEKAVSAQLGCTNPALEAPEGKCPLEPETTYHLRLAAENGAPGVVTKGAESTFTTTAPVAGPTILSTEDATEVGYRTAKVSGSLERPAGADPALDVNCRFEYVTDQQFNATGFDGAARTPCTPDPVTASGPVTVTAQLKLSSGPTYHLRLFAQNGGGTVTKEAASTFTTVPITTIDSVSPADVSYDSAHLTGTVVALPSIRTYWSIVYSPVGVNDDNPLAWTNPEPQIGGIFAPSEAGTHTFERELIGLKGGTEYQVAVVLIGFDDATQQYEGEYTLSPLPNPKFTTDPVDPPSVLSLDSASSVSYTTASVSGEISRPPNPHPAFDVDCHFEYVTDEQFNASGFENPGKALCEPEGNPGENPIHTVGPSKVTAKLTGLTHNTTYHLRLHAANASPTTDSKENTFTTLTVSPPIVTLDPVAPITATTAHFSGTVSANAPGGLDAAAEAAYETSWQIECVPACPRVLPAGTGAGVVKGSDGTKIISVDVAELDPNHPYEVKLTATNTGGTSAPVRLFSTPLIPPTVKSTPGGSDGEGGYTLQGVVNPNNSLVTDCKFEWGPNLPYAFEAPCSPAPGGGVKNVTVEAHLPGLTPGAVYHARLVATNGGGTADGGDFTFIPTLKAKETCANEQQRKENSSFALPECRAYEQVSDPSKEGYGAVYNSQYGDDTAQYRSRANNIANSGAGAISTGWYTTLRTDAGWKTVANLNGPSGSPYNDDEFREGYPNPVFSADLRSSIWRFIKPGEGGDYQRDYLRRPDGQFVLIGETLGRVINARRVSDDLNHMVIDGNTGGGFTFGHGVYEYIGTGSDLPERIDLDNSGTPIVSGNCGFDIGYGEMLNALSKALSSDGRVVVLAVPSGCPGDDIVVDGVWARVDQKVSYDLTKSQCTRGGANPCNGPSNATFAGAARDGSRVFFTTKQQLLNGDTDQTNDLYACDIPLGPQVPTGDANSCSALRLVSGAAIGADVLRVLEVSDDGSTAVFTARGVLADNEDAYGNEPTFGDDNLYTWRSDAANPDGQTTFAARLSLDPSKWAEGYAPSFAATPDGRFLMFESFDRLVETDSDGFRDVYRYDVEAGELTRISVNLSGTGGNGDFEANARGTSDDGQKMIFETPEPLSPLDGNGETDVYLWSSGRVSLIGTGSAQGGSSSAAISASGKNIYFSTGQVLSPSDIDVAGDVYTARIGGGFVFSPKPTCTGETCQPKASDPPAVSTPALPNPEGNVKPKKTCPKGKIAKGKKCVKKPKKPRKKKGKGKRASDKRGGGK